MVQEGFVGLLKSLESYRGGVKFSTYCYRSIYWQILKFKHQQKKQKRLFGKKAYYNTDVLFEDIKDIISSSEYEIIVLKMNNLSFKEIAIQKQISKTTAFKIFNSGIDKLQHAFIL